jgi:hypothetical protein
MHRRIAFALIALTFALAPAVLRAGEEEMETKRPKLPETLYSGEIVGLEETSFRIRPWDPKLPARLTVTASGATRYFRQSKGGRDEIKPGEVVLVVETKRKTPKLPRPKDETEEQRLARVEQEKELQREALKKPGMALGVLRLWQAPPQAGISAEDILTGRILLRGALGYFEGFRAGSQNAPRNDNPVTVGVVKSTKPLVLTVGEEDKAFRTEDETIWVTHTAIKPDDLKKEKTVLIHSPTPPGADGTLQALLIAVCPEPNRGPAHQRKLILRDRKAKN